MPGRCVPGRGVVAAITIGLISTVVSRGAAEPTAGFPVEEPAPPPASPSAAPATDPAPANDAPAPPVAPVAPEPSAPAAEPVAAPPAYAELPAPALSGGPLVLPYHSGHPVPAGYHVESRPANGLIAAGSLTLAAGYVAALGLGLDKSFSDGNGWLVVPVVGPWGALGARSYRCRAQTVEEARKCFNDAYGEATTLALLAVDGMLQATGLVLLLAGLASGREELVRDDAAKLTVTGRSRPEGGFDLGLRGRF